MIDNAGERSDLVWDTITSMKKNHSHDCGRVIPVEEIRDQVTFLQNEFDTKPSNSGANLNSKVLRKAAEALLFISFCFKKPSGLSFLENLARGNKGKQLLLNKAVADVHDSYFENKVWANFSKIEEERRFYNWYHGRSVVSWPYWENELKYLIRTSASIGSIKTQFFGDKYIANKVERQLTYEIYI